MPLYIAPYLISQDHPNVPTSGTFTVPVCTTPERFHKITSALFYGSLHLDEIDYDHLVDWLDACTRITEGCVEFFDQCRTIALNDARITWYPESPYAPNEELPSGYSFHPWTVVDNSILGTLIGVWGLGYKVGDVYTDITKFPIFTSWVDFLTNYGNLPRFTISDLDGEGTVNLHLLNIPQGGRLIVVRDGVFDLLNLGGIELNKDLVSYPQESQTDLIVPIEITGLGAHTLTLIFAPVVDDTFIPLFFGGGIRSIELCGFGVTPMPTDACCDETNDLLRKIVNLMDGGMTASIKFDSGSSLPDFRVDCTPEKFEGNPDDTVPEITARATALCVTVSRYIIAVMYNLAVQMNALATTKNHIKNLITPLAIPNEFTSELEPPGIPITENLLLPADLDIARIFHLATDLSTLVDEIICEMIDSLTGKQNTFANFKASIVDSVEPTDEESNSRWLLHRLIKWSNEIRPNFIIFSRQLESTFDEINDGLEYDCPCAPVEDSITLVDYIGTGCVITPLGGNVFRIEQNTADRFYGESEDYYHASAKDSLDRCIIFHVVEGYPDNNDDGIAHGLGCCGQTDFHGEVGGFGEVFVHEVNWQHKASDRPAINSVYRVELVPEEDCL